jgi:hypothetical protein
MRSPDTGLWKSNQMCSRPPSVVSSPSFTRKRNSSMPLVASNNAVNRGYRSWASASRRAVSMSDTYSSGLSSRIGRYVAGLR